MAHYCSKYLEELELAALPAPLFLLCVNLFLNLFAKLSDNLRSSLARVCADDIGSASHTLSTFETIFRLAASVAGLHLKPAKCVLVTTCTKLCGDTHFATINWPRISVVEFAEFVICSSGNPLVGILVSTPVKSYLKTPFENLFAESMR